jgi:hypothetical protein
MLLVNAPYCAAEGSVPNEILSKLRLLFARLRENLCTLAFDPNLRRSRQSLVHVQLDFVGLGVDASLNLPPCLLAMVAKRLKCCIVRATETKETALFISVCKQTHKTKKW